jgi:glycosyltransferase involved in cell wall biosynthesis
VDAPLLTVAIPTFNRAPFLETCLANLVPQAAGHGDAVEILVLDNASTDQTAEVVERYAARCPVLRAMRHPENLGSDRNIAACFQRARGRYVLVLGDDDVLLPGALARVLPLLDAGHGVVFLRPFGFDRDFIRERPPVAPGHRIYRDPQAFVMRVHHRSTFISANVVNRERLAALDLGQAIGTNLVQAYCFFKAVLGSPTSVMFDDYLVAAKRNNSGGYDLLRVFVTNLNAVLDKAMEWGLGARARESFVRSMVTTWLPRYIAQSRAGQGEPFDAPAAHQLLRSAYPRSVLYWLFVYPAVRLPVSLAMLWGAASTFIGRIADGDLYRMLKFIEARAMHAWRGG